MTLKIGRDVQFIKTEMAGRDFKESKVVTVCSKITGERQTVICGIKKKRRRFCTSQIECSGWHLKKT